MIKKISFLSALAFFVLAAGGVSSVQAAGIGDVVKCPDFSSVYYLAADGNRYAFPNESVYLSWYPDFTQVKTIVCSDLASLRLAGLVPYQAGTRLVKIPSAPTVYAVGPQGVLQPLQDEQQAIRLYGSHWADQIDDVSEAFFGTYTIEDSLLPDTLPIGLPIVDASGHYFLVQADGLATQIDIFLSHGEGTQISPSALSLTDLEKRLGFSIPLIMTNTSSDSTLLETVSETFQPVLISAENAVSSDTIDFSEQTDSSGTSSSTDTQTVSQNTSDLETIMNQTQDTSSQLDSLTDQSVSLE